MIGESRNGRFGAFSLGASGRGYGFHFGFFPRFEFAATVTAVNAWIASKMSARSQVSRRSQPDHLVGESRRRDSQSSGSAANHAASRSGGQSVRQASRSSP